jgi:hypothetical protein
MLFISRLAKATLESSRKAELHEQRFNGLREWSTVQPCCSSAASIDTLSLKQEATAETDQLQSGDDRRRTWKEQRD